MQQDVDLKAFGSDRAALWLPEERAEGQ